MTPQPARNFNPNPNPNRNPNRNRNLDAYLEADSLNGRWSEPCQSSSSAHSR